MSEYERLKALFDEMGVKYSEGYVAGIFGKKLQLDNIDFCFDEDGRFEGYDEEETGWHKRKVQI